LEDSGSVWIIFACTYFVENGNRIFVVAELQFSDKFLLVVRRRWLRITILLDGNKEFDL
jgi:hypothetical protein